MFNKIPQNMRIPDFPFAVEIIESTKRKKTVSIEVHPAKVVVRVPASITNSALRKVLHSRRDWLLQKWQQVQDAAVNASQIPEQESGHNLQQLARLPAHVLVYGEPCPVIHHMDADTKTFRLNFRDKQVVITSPTNAIGNTRLPEVARELVVSWLKRLARKHLQSRLDYFAPKMHVDYQTFRLKDQKTRWGSCSSLGNINLNWRLIQAPNWVSDYVVIHELAHLVELNHSPAFWAIVARYCPDYQDAKKWLHRHASELHAW